MAATEGPVGPKNVFDHVSLRARLTFYAGVFCLFAPFSLIYDLASPKGLSWQSLAAWTAYSGVTSVGWAYAFTRNLRFLWIWIPVSFLVPQIFGDAFYIRHGAQPGLIAEAVICLSVIVLGYVFFVVFISGEGAKTMRLRTEINLARQIHAHLVPVIDQATERLELYGVSVPASEVGGDLMDVCIGRGKTGLYVADVTGHGVSAGVSMSMIKSAIRMKLRDNPELGEMITGLNDVLVETQRPSMLATFAALEVHTDGRARYALAGHLPILHYSAPTQTLARLDNEHPPLGVLAGRVFSDEAVDAARGDLFVILTDGLTEVFDRNGEEYGQSRIERIVTEQADRPLREIHDSILAAVRSFGPQIDDQTLLLARIR
jgi:phosphoserine phosphatase RsbU/P